MAISKRPTLSAALLSLSNEEVNGGSSTYDKNAATMIAITTSKARFTEPHRSRDRRSLVINKSGFLARQAFQVGASVADIDVGCHEFLGYLK